MSRTFQAKYQTVCEACGWDIERGEDAIYNSDNEVVHLDCTDEPEPAGITF